MKWFSGCKPGTSLLRVSQPFRLLKPTDLTRGVAPAMLSEPFGLKN